MLCLVLQDGLSPQAREFASAVDRIEAGAAEGNRLSREVRELRERLKGAKGEERSKVQAEIADRTAKQQELSDRLKRQVADLRRALDRALTLDREDWGLYEVRSRLNELVGDPKRAAEDLDRVLEKRPGHVPALLRRASLDRRAGRYEEARRRLEPLLRCDSPEGGALAEDGLAAYALNEFSVALARLESAVKAASLAPVVRGEVEETLPAARESVAQWKEELRLRSVEEKGDPLPRVRLATSAGEIEIELFENEAPIAVSNFVALTERKFFDGTRIHRAIPGLVAQGGDPNSRNDDPEDDGKGGPGYLFADELPPGKFRRHFRGSLAMANAGPNTNGSQFFLTRRPTPWLDGKHVVFGRVVKGMDVVDRLGEGDSLLKSEIVRKRDHPYRTPE